MRPQIRHLKAACGNRQYNSFSRSLQGMHMGFGGNPYGPAGTGKTESVKALGQAFGRQVSQAAGASPRLWIAVCCCALCFHIDPGPTNDVALLS